MCNQPLVFKERGITEPDYDSKIWKYTDYHQLFEMLENRYLSLVSPLLFPDSQEGAYSEANLKSILNKIKEGDSTQGETQFHNLHHEHEDAHGFSRNIYVTCWNVSEIENMLMWNCYSTLENGVAIVTTYKKLKSIFDDQFYIGEIKYYTPESQLPENSIERHFYKVEPYQGEREVRVLYFDNPINSNNFEIANNILKFKINPNQLFETIVTSPNSDKDFIETVRSLAASHKINVQQSGCGESIKPKKLKNLLSDIYGELKLCSNNNCDECRGQGFVKKGTTMIFCTNCQIKNKWEKIKAVLIKKYS